MADKADKAARSASDRFAGDPAASLQRLRLQTDYGQALMWSKGFSAEETRTAFARATELAANTADFSERFAACHSQWTLAINQGEFKSARELASAFLREAEEKGRVAKAGVARRGLAVISYFSGDFPGARTHCERALDACRAERDQEVLERFGQDTGAITMCCLALTNWELGEVERARELIDMANRRAAELGHVPSMANPLYWKSHLEILRGDAVAALSAAEALEALSREHGMTLWRVWSEVTCPHLRAPGAPCPRWAHHIARPLPGTGGRRGAMDLIPDNGKAERFIQTSLREWAYGRPYNTSDERIRSGPDPYRFLQPRRYTPLPLRPGWPCLFKFTARPMLRFAKIGGTESIQKVRSGPDPYRFLQPRRYTPLPLKSPLTLGDMSVREFEMLSLQLRINDAAQWRNPRLQPKSAFLRFAPVHRIIGPIFEALSGSF
jgi:hypothetical protein